MNTPAAVALATLAILLADLTPARATEPDSASARHVLGALSATALPDADLGRGRARGVPVTEATSLGTVRDNRVGNGSVTGVIANTNSVNNNAGLTTVFQNTGNNALLQSSTSIYISVR